MSTEPEAIVQHGNVEVALSTKAAATNTVAAAPAAAPTGTKYTLPGANLLAYVMLPLRFVVWLLLFSLIHILFLIFIQIRIFIRVLIFILIHVILILVFILSVLLLLLIVLILIALILILLLLVIIINCVLKTYYNIQNMMTTC